MQTLMLKPYKERIPKFLAWTMNMIQLGYKY